MQNDPLLGLSQRVLPQNLQAEQALLGALLSDNKALARVEEFLRPHHFSDPLNGWVYRLVLDWVAHGQVADAVSLRRAVENEPAFAEVGGARYLAGLLSSFVAFDSVKPYGQTVRDAWTRRAMIAKAAETMERCFAPGDLAASAIMEQLDAGLLEIFEGAGEDVPLTGFGDAAASAVEGAIAASQRASPLAGLSTGYAGLDRLTTGLMSHSLVLIGARPSMGKTSLGLGIAVRAAMNGSRVLFWSGEMEAPQLAARAAAAYCSLPTQAVFTGRNWSVPLDAHAGRLPPVLGQSDWDALVAAERAAHSLPLFFDTRPGVTVQAIRARARRMRRSGGLDMIVLDYVGLMRASDPKLNGLKAYERITVISAEIMALKQELGIPVVAMVQLSRGNEGRDDKAPQLHDLRDSGALEQDANVVMMVHRPHYYLTRTEPSRRGNETAAAFQDRREEHDRQESLERGWANVAVLKNRQGPVGTVRLRFQDETTWFRDRDEAPDSPAWAGRMDI